MECKGVRFSSRKGRERTRERDASTLIFTQSGEHIYFLKREFDYQPYSDIEKIFLESILF